MPGYLCGMASYVLVGEAAVGRLLVGQLAQPTFPDALRTRGPEKWVWEAQFALENAASHARRGDRVACIGKCAFGIIAIAQARLLERKEWALNEKGIVERAELSDVEQWLWQRDDLAALVDAVRHALGFTV